MKRILAALFVSVIAFAFCAVIPAAVNAQSLKIGFVKDDRFRNEYKAWKTAEDEIDTQLKAWNEEAQAKQTELQTMMDDYDKQRLILSDEKKKEREAQIRSKNDDLDSFTKSVFGPNGLAEQKQRQLAGVIQKKITDAIQAIALQDGYDIVFTLSSVGYIKETFDVTDKVLKYLEENE